MFRFNETIMHSVVTFPKRLWDELNIYTFILSIPFMLLILAISIPGALVVDVVIALVSSIGAMFDI